MEARQEREDFAELPSCANPWKKRRVCDAGVRKKGNTRKTNFVILCVLIVLSVIPVLLGRYWVEDELSFVFKNKVTGRVIRVELKAEESASIALDQIRRREYPEALKGYAGEMVLVGINYATDPSDPDYKHHTCVIEKWR